jgi:hypothetical protein
LRLDCPAPKEEVDHWVGLSDKDQFSEFASGKLTFAQLKRSIAQRRFGVEYMTVDDYMQHNDPKFTAVDSGRKSYGGRCNRSLNHQPAAKPNKQNWYFQNRGRDEPKTKEIPTAPAADSSEVQGSPKKLKVKKTLWK